MPGMTLSEALSMGLQVTGVGLIIVFSVLIILMLVMIGMKYVFYKPEKPKKNSKPQVKASESKAPISVEKTTDSELIAVLAAAVAASMDVPVSALKIKSYKKVGGASSAWNRAGVKDIIDSRF